MAGRRAEVPHPGLPVAGEERPARQLVACPFADHGARDVADVVLVEEEQASQTGAAQRLAHPAEAVGVEAPEVHALLEVDLHVAGGLERPVPAMARVDGGLGGRRLWCQRRRLAGHGMSSGSRLSAATLHPLSSIDPLPTGRVVPQGQTEALPPAAVPRTESSAGVVVLLPGARQKEAVVAGLRNRKRWRDAEAAAGVPSRGGWEWNPKSFGRAGGLRGQNGSRAIHSTGT